MMKEELDLNKGQHILIDKNVLDKEIEESDLNKDDMVIEIGAGTGLLTKKLCKKAKEVLTFEIDKIFIEDLNNLSEKYKNIKIIFGDALKYDWRGYNKIVSNIPYYLSEEVVKKAIIADIKEIVLIIGERFKELLFSNEKIGLIARKFYSIEEIIKVPKESFEPMPRVNSFLIRLKKKDNIAKTDIIMLNISFGKGKVKNSIIRALFRIGKTKREARGLIEKINIDKKILEKPVKMITGKLLLRMEKGLKGLGIF